MRKITLILIVLLISINQNCFAYWVWSPKTGKWINPVYRTFDTAEEQFNWAKNYFDEEDYRKAIFEFKKVLKKFRESKFAPEAKYFIGFSYEKLGKLRPAFKTYEEVIEAYPLNDRLDEIVERQYLIAELYFKRKKYQLAKEIFDAVLLNAPYSKVSDVAQYKSGLCLFKMRQFNSAWDEFEKIPENYSFSPYLDDARFRMALCSFKMSSLVEDYDEGLIDNAIGDLVYFLRKFETSEYVPEVKSLLNKLEHSKAERLFRIAYFYEKQKRTFAARKYYEELMYTYEKTAWAKKAKPRLERLKDK